MPSSAPVAATKVFAPALAALMLGACAYPYGNEAYRPYAGMRVELGIVEGLRAVTIEGTQHGAGTAAGVTATAQGVEITVQLDSGRTLVVVQEGPVDAFRPGDRIRVLADGYTTRVSR